MLKYLLISLIFSADLFGRPQVAENQRGAASANAQITNKSERVIPPTHVVIDPPLPASSSQPPAPANQKEAKEKPWQWLLRPEWVIVYITAIYAFIAGWTLMAIKRQADLMDRQTEASINRERARIRVELENLNLEPLLEDRPTHMARYKVELHGPSPAFILDTLAHAYVSSSPEPEYSEVNPPMGFLETVITPRVPVIEAAAFIIPKLNVGPSEVETEVRQRRSFIHFHGFIKYKDVFDRERETRFRYIWHVADRPGGIPFSYWKKCGTENDNTET